jgi:hypothetical protein
MDLRRPVNDLSRARSDGQGASQTEARGAGRAIQQEALMARSKYVTGGIVASIIWLIVGTVAIVYRNTYEAREANIVARTSCRGQDDFNACLDAYYASVGGAPGIDWTRICLALLGGLAVIWVIVFVLKAVRGDTAAD